MAKQLSDILEAAAQVRDEQTPEANTAERVGGVLTDLAQYVGQSLMVSDVQVEADATGLYLKLYFNDDNGEPYERKLKLPNANPNAENPKSGVLSPALFDELKAAGGFKDLGEFDTVDEALDYCATPEVAGNTNYFTFRFKAEGYYYYLHQSLVDDMCVQEIFMGMTKEVRVIFFDDETLKNVANVGAWGRTRAVRLWYDREKERLVLKDLAGFDIGDPVSLPLARPGQNGLMSGADKSKLDALDVRVAALEAAASAAAE